MWVFIGWLVYMIPVVICAILFNYSVRKELDEIGKTFKEYILSMEVRDFVGNLVIVILIIIPLVNIIPMVAMCSISQDEDDIFNINVRELLGIKSKIEVDPEDN